jgi:plastocyanin
MGLIGDGSRRLVLATSSPVTGAWSVDGLPAHPLIVHAPVIALPVLGLALAAWPWIRARRHSDSAAFGAAALGALLAIVAVASGERLADDLGSRRMMASHASRGELVRALSIVLVVLVAVRLGFARRSARHRPTGASAAAGQVLGVAVSLLALSLIPATVRAGHSGAEASWRARYGTRPPAGAGSTAVLTTSPAPTTISVTPGTESAVVSSLGTVGLPGPAPAAAPTTAAPALDPNVVNVAMGEWSLVVDRTQALRGSLLFRVRNAGTRPHAFRIRSAGSGRDRVEYRTDVIDPGGTVDLAVTLGEGSWELDCPVEDDAGEHDGLGMEAPLQVTRNAPRPAATTAAVPPQPPVPEPAAPAPGPGVVTPPAAGTSPAPGVPTSPAAAAAVAAVSIRAFAFAPAALTVAPGTSVVWTNEDPAPHTATGEGFDTGHLGQGASGSVTLQRKGTYTYVCTIHPSMTATLTVT